MIRHNEITGAVLHKLIRKDKICFGGNERLKIYGTLKCRSGRRMKKVNRVFFASEQEAIGCGYRPCGSCMKTEYQKWKNRFADL